MATNYPIDGKSNQAHSLNTQRISSPEHHQGTASFSHRYVEERKCQSLPTAMSADEGMRNKYTEAYRKVTNLSIDPRQPNFSVLVNAVNDALRGKPYIPRLAAMIADGSLNPINHKEYTGDETLLKQAREYLEKWNLPPTQIELLGAIIAIKKL